MTKDGQRVYALARRRANRLYQAPGFRRAYTNGALNALEGKPVDVCPYRRDDRKTWRAVYRRAWIAGYTYARDRNPKGTR